MNNKNPYSPKGLLKKEKLYNLWIQKNIEKYFFAILNIDNFRYINDNFGHSVGDKFLINYGEKLVKIIGDMGLVYKFNGDEFILLLEKSKLKSVDSIIKKIHKELNEIFYIDGYEIIMTSSIGIYEPHAGESIENSIRKAFIALYQAKEKGCNQYACYTQETEEEIKRKSLLIIELRKNLQNKNFKEFYIVYQPIYSIEKNQIEEVEALIRWENPLLGSIPPSEFIPVAEETGIIRELGYWLIDEVIKHIKQWQKEGINLRVAINLSPKQVEEKEFLNKIKNILKKEKIEYKKVKFEITETQILSLNKENQKILEEFIKLGTDIAIDDFGEGYSSIKNIVFFPINAIKIDKSLVDFVHKDTKIQLLISSFISFAHQIGYQVTAEGVENKEQFDRLIKYGCDKIQGYYIKEPVNEIGLVNFIKKL